MMLVSFCAVAVACALLSLVVVTRRWAFIGEGIGHSGFGGAGTAWMIMAVAPALDVAWLPYVFVVGFSLAAALGMGLLSRRGQVTGDVALGVFLVATVAWGFIGQQVYVSLKRAEPAGFFTLFFGKPTDVTPQYTMAAVCVLIAVALAMLLLRREIIAYCVDPTLAETSGVRVGLVHYLLISMVAVTTIVGLHIVGTLLITALLVLPGATGLLLSRRLETATTIACVSGVAGAVAGYVVYRTWPIIPLGPAFVLVMFVLFLVAFGVARIRRT
jgi:manganese transport system permease protein